MDKLLLLMSKCKCGVHLTVNTHRDYYETVAEHLDDHIKDIDPLIMLGMVELNTIIDLQFYPDTPVGFHQCYHFDLDEALTLALECFGDK